jgi:hypothetical protein
MLSISTAMSGHVAAIDLRRGEPVRVGHRGVHHDDARLELGGESDGLVAVAGFADDGDLGSSSSRRRKPRRTMA